MLHGQQNFEKAKMLERLYLFISTLFGICRIFCQSRTLMSRKTVASI